MQVRTAVLLAAYLAQLARCLSAVSDSATAAPTASHSQFDLTALQTALPNVTKSGFLTVDETAEASLFYAFYEAQQPSLAAAPIVLWLQVSQNKLSCRLCLPVSLLSDLLFM